MKTRALYICETCGAEYEYEATASLCESLPTAKQVFKIGDKVECQTKYDGYQPAKITKIEIYNPLSKPFKGWEGNIGVLTERLKKGYKVQHEIFYLIDEELQQGKETWTKYWTKDFLRKVSKHG